ncbi:protein kinase domain-containing protein [Planotetraspora sp. GP83]|uniref:serine/threonine-protein kinase n=1 Tax=Planotetraspora sp. GP83 TaxID=3156264 RepID=UPI003511876E
MADAQISDRVVAGRYRLIEPLGRGGMGTVWRAMDEVLQREVAVKELLASAELTGPEREIFTVRTFREARAAGRLSHPGVAAVYDVFEENGHPWIVLELVPSRTLGSIVRDEGPLPPQRVAEIGLQVLGALRAAHAAGVLHRDVKPDNVLMAHDGRAVLTDFGIAAMEDDSPVTRTGMLIGTPAFIAPERAAGAQAQRASDLWSLGVTLFLAVEGRSPFHRGHALATLAAVMYEEPGPLHRAGSLAPVITGLLIKDPSRRITAEEAAAQLMAVSAGQVTDPIVPAPRNPRFARLSPARAASPAATGVSTPTPLPYPGTSPAFSTAPPPQPRRVRWGLAAGATALVALVGVSVGGVAYMTARTPDPGTHPISTPTVTVFATRTAEAAPTEHRTEPTSRGRTGPVYRTAGSTGPTGHRRSQEPTTKPSPKSSPKDSPTPKASPTKSADGGTVEPSKGKAGGKDKHKDKKGKKSKASDEAAGEQDNGLTGQDGDFGDSGWAES